MENNLKKKNSKNFEKIQSNININFRAVMYRSFWNRSMGQVTGLIENKNK